MNYKIIILLILFCFTANVSSAQKKKFNPKSEKISKSKFSKTQEVYDLDQAKAIMHDQPAAAVRILEQVVLDAYETGDKFMEAEAYTLLGNIFEKIDQKKLAIQRYEQALQIYLKMKGPPQLAEIAERIASLELGFGNSKRASQYYQMCISSTFDEELRQRCTQGVYDVRILNLDTIGLVNDLNIDINNNLSDSMLLLQNYSRITRLNVQQNNYGGALSNFKKAVRSLPKSKEIDKSDYEPVQQAMDELLNFENLSNADLIEIRNNVNLQSPKLAPIKEILVTENMEIAELYLKENRLVEAEKFIEASKEFIDVETPASTTAKVFKKSAEISQKKGRMDKALLDLDKYVEAKELSISKLEAELEKEIEVVTAQQKIDISIKDSSLDAKEEQLVSSQLRTQRILIALLSTLLLAALIFFYFLYKSVKAKREANQKLLLKSLRTQMNPHFIFNALNSVNNFIAKNDEKTANKFLSDFSRLMRKVLDYSERDFITFEEELELNELYLKLEHFRFRDKFDYSFKNEIEDQSFDLEIPPMLIQPFIENAVWHGLRYKESMGSLTVSVTNDRNKVIVKVIDDGIGRAKSKTLKTENQKKYKSKGLQNIEKRIELINELYNKNYTIEVQDADASAQDKGTLVKISIPIET